MAWTSHVPGCDGPLRGVGTRVGTGVRADTRSETGAENTIRVSAVVLRRPDGMVLTVRKAGTAAFMFPGGKPGPGEPPLDTAVRELAEETGVVIGPEDLRHVGLWETETVNEPGRCLHSEVFEVRRPLARNEVTAPAAEIEELAWVDPAAPAVPGGHLIAPLLLAVFRSLVRVSSQRGS